MVGVAVDQGVEESPGCFPAQVWLFKWGEGTVIGQMDLHRRPREGC
jgi:hypothetical protein